MKPEDFQAALRLAHGAFDAARARGAHPDVLAALGLPVDVLDGLSKGVVPQIYTRATYRACARAMRAVPEVAKIFDRLEPRGSP
jgi:hypothetical protein